MPETFFEAAPSPLSTHYSQLFTHKLWPTAPPTLKNTSYTPPFYILSLSYLSYSSYLVSSMCSCSLPSLLSSPFLSFPPLFCYPSPFPSLLLFLSLPSLNSFLLSIPLLLYTPPFLSFPHVPSTEGNFHVVFPVFLCQ